MTRSCAVSFACVVSAALAFTACGSSDSHRKVLEKDSGPPATGGAPSTGGTSSGGASGSGGTKATGGTAPVPVPEAGPPDSGLDAAAPMIYVNPVTGLDTNDGTVGAPFKTIQKAATAAALAPGQTILLANGIYDAATQAVLNVTFPVDTTLRGATPGGVTLKGDGSTTALQFAAGGGVEDVTFDSFSQGVSASGTGAFHAKGVHFTNSHDGFYFKGSVVATVDASGATPMVASVGTGGFSLAFLDAEDTADVTFTGGTFDAVATSPGGGLFMARGSAKLTLSGVTIANMPVRAITVNDNADAVLDNVSIRGMAASGAGPVIAVGGQNTAQPLNPSVELKNGSEVSQNPATAIGLSLYGVIPTKALIKLTGSRLHGNTGYGILVTAPAIVDPGLVATIEATDSTLHDNTLGGISADTAAITMTGGGLRGNGTDGITLTGTGTTLGKWLKMRGTMVDANLGHGVSFEGPATSVLDLGKTGDPGGIVFTNVAVGYSAVNLKAAIQGFAVGNTWMPGVQNADATGKYLTPRTLPAASAGLNATIAAGGSLVVAQ